MSDLGAEHSSPGAFSTIVVDCTPGGKGRRGSLVSGDGAGGLGSEVMMGNDGVEDTLDNDGGAKSPDDEMKAQNTWTHLLGQ